MLRQLFHQTLFFCLASTSFGLASVSIARADMARVRCDFYIQGEENTRESDTCEFFQRQGFVGLTKSDGTRYDFVPKDYSKPNIYEDGDGERVIREKNDEGLVFTTQRELIYIYWNNDRSNSQDYFPKTYTYVRDFQNIDLEITQGKFRFYGTLKRVSSDLFMGSDKQVRVNLNPYSGNIVVYSKATGNVLYNYNITPISGVGENPDTMCDSTKEPC